jgi:GNAT superfamily N-acetyltransferase
MQYKIIDLKNPTSMDMDMDMDMIGRVQEHYNDICKSVSKTRSIKKVGMFGSVKTWQQMEDAVPVLPIAPLNRMLPDYDEVYSSMNNILVVCLDDDQIIGFLGGVTDALELLEKFFNHRALSSYDQVKYTNIYNYIAGEDKNPGMSWIEIICVHPEGRGKGVSKALIDNFISYSKKHRGTADGLVVGLDIVGTVKGGINTGLKKVYQGLGFDFDMPSNKGEVYTMFNGSQFAGMLV